MTEYELMSRAGRIIGKILVEDDTLTNAIMDEDEIQLGGLFIKSTREFGYFVILNKTKGDR